MTKYHINKKGKPSVCRAIEGHCPLGGFMGDENHFDTFEEAEKFVYKENLERFGIIPEVEENNKKNYKQIPIDIAL